MENANYGSPAKPYKPRKGGKDRKGGKSKKDQCSDPQSLAKVEGACNGKKHVNLQSVIFLMKTIV